MDTKQYTDEFKTDAARQVLEHGRTVREFSLQLRVSIDSMCSWLREHRVSPGDRQTDVELAAESRQLQAEVKRLSKERNIPEKSRGVPVT